LGLPPWLPHEQQDCSEFARLLKRREHVWEQGAADGPTARSDRDHDQGLPQSDAAAIGRGAGIAKAAETCADTGNFSKGLEIALDVEQLLYEVSKFLNAASLINRLGKSQ
jgi:hypothetical protein